MRMRRPPPLAAPDLSSIADPSGIPGATPPPGLVLDGPVDIPSVPGPHPGAAGNPIGPDARATSNGSYTEEHPQFAARVEQDGRVAFSDAPNVGLDGVSAHDGMVGLSGHFDLTDAIMRMHGEDPYLYEKAKFLDRTRDARAGMALGARHERLGEALARMPAVLERVWSHAAWTPAERRRLLFQLWDEVAEDGPAEVVQTGRQIRATILAFIRKRLVWGTADGYTPGELDELNRHRASRARFDPYR